MAFEPLVADEGDETLSSEEIVKALRVCDACGSVVPYWRQADHLLRCPPPKTIIKGHGG